MDVEAVHIVFALCFAMDRFATYVLHSREQKKRDELGDRMNRFADLYYEEKAQRKEAEYLLGMERTKRMPSYVVPAATATATAVEIKPNKGRWPSKGTPVIS